MKPKISKLAATLKPKVKTPLFRINNKPKKTVLRRRPRPKLIRIMARRIANGLI